MWRPSPHIAEDINFYKLKMKKLVLKLQVVEALTSHEEKQVQGGKDSVWKDCTARPTLTQTVQVPKTVGGCYSWMTCPVDLDPKPNIPVEL